MMPIRNTQKKSAIDSFFEVIIQKQLFFIIWSELYFDVLIDYGFKILVIFGFILRGKPKFRAMHSLFVTLILRLLI